MGRWEGGSGTSGEEGGGCREARGNTREAAPKEQAASSLRVVGQMNRPPIRVAMMVWSYATGERRSTAGKRQGRRGERGGKLWLALKEIVRGTARPLADDNPRLRHARIAYGGVQHQQARALGDANARVARERHTAAKASTDSCRRRALRAGSAVRAQRAARRSLCARCARSRLRHR